jgi:hypothetical protein
MISALGRGAGAGGCGIMVAAQRTAIIHGINQ